jgi:hypothetical protein
MKKAKINLNFQKNVIKKSKKSKKSHNFFASKIKRIIEKEEFKTETEEKDKVIFYIIKDDLYLTPFQKQFKKRLDTSKFRYMNEQLYSMSGSEAKEYFEKNPENFILVFNI